MRLHTRSLVPFSLGAIAVAMLSACGGGSDTAPPVSPPPPPPPVVVTGLTGTAAVGAPMTSGLLRVLDSAGNVVAHDIVINADGTYDAGTLTGTGPWRVEACGYAGPNYRCIYAVVQAAGTGNVTPLTSALITLATGDAPEAIMDADGSAPDAAALAAAQAQLQAGLAGTLADAGVPANFDFTTGALAAGTRSGYDRILDALNVTTGSDNGAFVQVTPRLGDGNLYLTTGTTSGTITTAAGAADLPLGSLETLFGKMTAAMASSAACTDVSHGLGTVVASDARMNVGDGGLSGGANVAAGLCQFFDHGDGGQGPMWGSRMVSPTLGKCDLTGADPLCAVSFALQDPSGDVENVGDGMGVVFRDKHWQFFGDLLPIGINANAAVQRGVRVDDVTAPIQYSRALQFDITRTNGVQCVKVSQLDDAHTTVAYYKLFAQDAERMSLWTTDGNGNTPSTDPAVGSLRSSDDSWVSLPQGTAGDDVIRTFYRAGRAVTMSVYSDAGCTAPAVLEGKSAFTVDIAGMPPVYTEMGSLPWGSLSSGTIAALEALTLQPVVGGSFAADWSFTDGVTGFEQATMCMAGSCGDGADARIGERHFHPNVRSIQMDLDPTANGLAAGDFKMFILGGRDGTGMNIESSFFSCTAQPAGQMCGQNPGPSQDPNSGAPTQGPTRTLIRSH